MAARYGIAKDRLLHHFVPPRGRCNTAWHCKTSAYQRAVSTDVSREHVKHQTRGPRQNALRKVAMDAERTTRSDHTRVDDLLTRHLSQDAVKKVTAYSAAEQYNMSLAVALLQQEGFTIDPFESGLYPQVLHLRLPARVIRPGTTITDPRTSSSADMMVFPSGTVVFWNVGQETATWIVKQVLAPANLNLHHDGLEIEQEDMDYVEDASKIRSEIAGETIVIGTANTFQSPSQSVASGTATSQASRSNNDAKQHAVLERNTILVKIAFASGIARSTKLAALERLTETYIASTRSIPLRMSKDWSTAQHQSRFLRRLVRGLSLVPRLPFSRPFILQKTGELLGIRAQLNLYGELTDSLPDLFWDSKHDLRLENYYDMVGRALDIGVRIKILNQKMDYAQEIATTLREMLNERHNLRLEWGIIVLIAIEVLFEIDQRWRSIDKP